MFRLTVFYILLHVHTWKRLFPLFLWSLSPISSTMLHISVCIILFFRFLLNFRLFFVFWCNFFMSQIVTLLCFLVFFAAVFFLFDSIKMWNVMWMCNKCTRKKGKPKWIGHTMEGDSLLRMVIERKWRGSRQEEDEGRWYCIRCWQVYIDSLKKRPSSKSSDDFGQLNLLRKQRIGRRTNKLEILFHKEFMTGKEEQDINAKHLTQNR